MEILEKENRNYDAPCNALICQDDFRKGNHPANQGKLQGGSFFTRHRLVLLGLILLNAILLIVTVVLGIYCAKVKEEAHEKSETERTAHEQTLLQLTQQKNLSDDLRKQVEMLQEERTRLLYNQTTLKESCSKCQPGWILLNSSCYFFSNPASNPKRNWPNSRADCISRGADLVVIDNWEEQQLLNDNYKTDSTSKTWWENGYWIGLTDIETEEKWVWINNVTQVETYWIPGEPNNHGPDGEDCGAFYFNGDPMKTRYDGKCQYHLYNWLCEIKLK
ncbi:CD209 antigen-like protein E [Thalassophryne amazonica]|uniref:CD209 antigen-like protein E n=1 Tax=Thalassophryne amazonica TaxID=390379 RepID=UPI001471725C|nr:CD209 antigen-like protein E [Thalassophryne amazonica]